MAKNIRVLTAPRFLSASALLDQLAKTPMFGPCDDAWLRDLAGAARIREGRRGWVLVAQGADFPYIGFVCDGVIGVTSTADTTGRGVHRLRLYEAAAGETFAEVGFIGGSTPLGEVSIVSKRALYALLPSTMVASQIEKDPALFARLASQAAARAHELAHRLVQHQSQPVSARLATFLLRYVIEDSDGLQPAATRLGEFTQRDIAAATGCVKEAAARAIGELEAAGALKREHGHIRHLDRAALTKYLS